MSDDSSVMNDLPVAVILLALPIVAVEIVLQLGATGVVGGPNAIGWRLAAIERFGFFTVVVDFMSETGRWSGAELLRFLTYPFVHGGMISTVFALALLLALGKMVGEMLGNFAVIAVFFASAVTGALMLTLLTDTPRPLIGAFPGIYGLIGSFTFILWAHATATGGPRAQAFSLIAMLMGIQLVFSIFFDVGVDWVADLAGFAAGFLLSFVLIPGGWTRLLALIRRR